MDVAAHARELPPEERDVMRQIALSARLDGMYTAGELLDHLAGLEPHERRDLLDRARAEVGLEPTGTVDTRSTVNARLAVSDDPRVQSCHAAGCRQIPVDASGALRLVDVRRWHCPDHEHLARAGDMDPVPSPWKLSPAGVPVPNVPDDDGREAAIAESRRAELEALDQEAAAGAAEMDSTESALADRMRRETPAGVPAP
jgi:hypothetical protein